MKFSTLCSIATLISLTAFCQSSSESVTEYHHKKAEICGGLDSVLARTGKWKKVEDANVFPDRTFPRNQFPQINSRLDKISLLMKEALPDLRGFEPSWYRSISGQAYFPNGPVPYQFSSLYLTYYCNLNLKQILLGDETGTWAYVFVNEYSWFFDKAGDWDIKGDGRKIGVYSLPPKVGAWKGKHLYAPKTHSGTSYAVVLGHDGKLPWRSLTREEYLLGFKRKLEEDKAKAISAYDETEEKLKNQKLPTNLTPELTKKLKDQHEERLRDFQSKKEERKTKTAKFYDDEIAPIDHYLKQADSNSLRQPVVIDPKTGYLKFRGTFGEENKGGIRLVAISTKYFKPELPRYVPQFMILYWRWERHDAPSLSFKKQFEENFPLEKLAALIDK